MTLALLNAVPAHAADPAGNYAIWGAGSRSCHQFLRAGNGGDADDSEFRNYLTGYLTAYNTLQGDTYNAIGRMSLDDALAWLADYCDLHKIDSYDRAIMQLVTDQHAQRQRSPGGSTHNPWGRVPAAPQPGH